MVRSECNCDTITTSGDVDYVSTSVTLTFDESSTRACSDISITPDDIYEGDETFSVTLTTGDGDVTLEPDSGVVTITDDDGGICYFTFCLYIHYMKQILLYFGITEVRIGFEETMYRVREDNNTVEVCARVLEGSLETSVVTTVESVDGSATGNCMQTSLKGM